MDKSLKTTDVADILILFVYNQYVICNASCWHLERERGSAYLMNFGSFNRVNKVHEWGVEL